MWKTLRRYEMEPINNTHKPMTWKQLRVELRNEFGRDGYKFYNDKNKHTRRIKIYGNNKYVVREYLNTKYPHLTVWETTQSRNHYNGICFNLNH